jgi:meiotic recombination protein SPO11
VKLDIRKRIYAHDLESMPTVAMLRVLQIVQQLLQQNRHATKRDVYYSDPAILKGELDLKLILLWCIIIL